jgi:hypothetical protein
VIARQRIVDLGKICSMSSTSTTKAKFVQCRWRGMQAKGVPYHNREDGETEAAHAIECCIGSNNIACKHNWEGQILRKYERMAEDGSFPVDGPQGGRYNRA